MQSSTVADNLTKQVLLQTLAVKHQTLDSLAKLQFNTEVEIRELADEIKALEQKLVSLD